jgi:hypothetical protein
MRRRRLGLKMPQRDVAKQLGVDKASVFNWKTNLSVWSDAMSAQNISSSCGGGVSDPSGFVGTATAAAGVGLSSYPEIYTAGYRYTGGLDDQHLDAFVVKLSESPTFTHK